MLKLRKARTSHICGDCRGVIEPGEYYWWEVPHDWAAQAKELRKTHEFPCQERIISLGIRQEHR